MTDPNSDDPKPRKPEKFSGGIYSDSYLEDFLKAVALLCLAPAIFGLFTLGRQFLDWLQKGIWTPRPLMSLFDRPLEFEWRGVGQVVDWFLQLPLSLAMVGLSVVLLIVMMGLAGILAAAFTSKGS